MMSMLLTKKHKTLQHKKLSWTSQNLSKKNYFLPRPTSVLMPLWMKWKENRAGWDWIKSKGYNPNWLAKNQMLLVISQSSWQWSNSHTRWYLQGEWRGTALRVVPGSLHSQLPDLSCRALLGFRAVICSTLTHAYTHLYPDICIQLQKAEFGRELCLWTSPLPTGCIPATRFQRHYTSRLMPAHLPRAVKTLPENFKIGGKIYPH